MQEDKEKKYRPKASHPWKAWNPGAFKRSPAPENIVDYTNRQRTK